MIQEINKEGRKKMKITESKRKTAVIACNVLILIFELIGFGMGITIDMFVYYTNLSNLAAALSCVLVLLEMSGRFGEKPGAAVSWFKYIAVCMTTVTLLVVLFILAPMQGMQMLYMGNFFSFHLICPVLMLVSFLFFEKLKLDSRKIYIGVLPTLCYAAVTILCNCIGILDGPYPFLRVREQPLYMSVIWCVVVLGIAGLIACLLMKFRKYKC